MDTYDNHPSQSILDAAYPDAPYRPGQGQQSTTALPSHSSTHGDFVYAPQSPSAPSWQQTPSSTTTNYGLSGVPDVPPPPYAPSPSSHHRPSGHAQRGIPLQTLSPTGVPTPPSPAHLWNGNGNDGSAFNTNSSTGPSSFVAIRPYGYVEPSGSGGSTMSGKPGPLAALRRRRRLRLCLVFLSLAILVMLVLIIGVAVGVIKENDGDDGDDNPPLPGFS